MGRENMQSSKFEPWCSAKNCTRRFGPHSRHKIPQVTSCNTKHDWSARPNRSRVSRTTWRIFVTAKPCLARHGTPPVFCAARNTRSAADQGWGWCFENDADRIKWLGFHGPKPPVMADESSFSTWFICWPCWKLHQNKTSINHNHPYLSIFIHQVARIFLVWQWGRDMSILKNRVSAATESRPTSLEFSSKGRLSPRLYVTQSRSKPGKCGPWRTMFWSH